MRNFLILNLMIGVTIFLNGNLVQAQSDRENAVEDVELVEDVIEVQEVIELDQGSESGGSRLTFLQILGRMHPALVHVPIGWIIMLFLLDLVTYGLKQKSFEPWGFYTLIGTILSFAPAMTTGFLNASFQSITVGEQLSLVTTHRNLVIGALVLCIIGLVLRVSQRRQLEGGKKWGYLFIIFVAVSLLGLAGHFGGKMVFGTNYLPF